MGEDRCALAWGADAEHDAGGEGQAAWGVPGLGQATVADGVRLIAGGIENVLQRFRLQVAVFCRTFCSPPWASTPSLPCSACCRSDLGRHGKGCARYEDGPESGRCKGRVPLNTWENWGGLVMAY